MLTLFAFMIVFFFTLFLFILGFLWNMFPLPAIVIGLSVGWSYSIAVVACCGVTTLPLILLPLTGFFCGATAQFVLLEKTS